MTIKFDAYSILKITFKLKQGSVSLVHSRYQKNVSKSNYQSMSNAFQFPIDLIYFVFSPKDNGLLGLFAQSHLTYETMDSILA